MIEALELHQNSGYNIRYQVHIFVVITGLYKGLLAGLAGTEAWRGHWDELAH